MPPPPWRIAKNEQRKKAQAENHGKLWKSLMRAHLGNYEIQEAALRAASVRT